MVAEEEYGEAVAAVTQQHTVDTKSIHHVRAGARNAREASCPRFRSLGTKHVFYNSFTQ